MKKFIKRLICLFFILHSSSLILMTGCGRLLSVAVAKTVGYDVPAKYAPVKTDTMLVLAEDFQNPGSSSTDCEQLSRYVCQELERKKVAPLIDPTAAMDLRSRDPSSYRNMSITQIGQTLGARQVMYIALLSNDVDSADGGEFRRAEAAARVRIVDVQTGQTRWPIEASSGYPVIARTPVVKITDENSESILRRALQQRLGGDIARLFYKYKVDEEGEGALGE